MKSKECGGIEVRDVMLFCGLARQCQIESVLGDERIVPAM